MAKLIFATKEDFEARGYVAETLTTEVLNERLAGASRFIHSQAPRLQADVLAGRVDVALVADIVCRMVARTLSRGQLDGVSQFSQTAGPFTQSATVANPAGDFYLTRAEKLSLGMGRGKAFEIDLLAGSRRGCAGDVFGPYFTS